MRWDQDIVYPFLPPKNGLDADTYQTWRPDHSKRPCQMEQVLDGQGRHVAVHDWVRSAAADVYWRPVTVALGVANATAVLDRSKKSIRDEIGRCSKLARQHRAVCNAR